MIPQSFIDDLLGRVDVADVVGRHVKLRKAGANLLGLCPFHSEKTPSFTVSPVKQFFHCFGCGAHGSAIGFLMDHGGLSYVDAIEELAQSAGLTVPQEAGRQGRRQPSEAPTLIDLLSTAARYYQRRLKESTAAIDYLKGRGLSGKTAARFALGFAPAQWRNLEAAVADYNDKSLVTAGLVKESGDEPAASATAADGAAPVVVRKRYDRFRNRVVFPIRNPRGGIIGFGGRVMNGDEPKYLNSPETPVFSKGRELYGLFEGRNALREKNQVIVVEGYMDVVMLAEHGVDNAVATLGTATTEEHVRKLLRIVDAVVFCFDGDKAGRKAAWRALETCLPIVSDTQRVQFLFLPDGEDPDSYVRQHGEAGFRQAVDNADPLSAFMLAHLSAETDLTTPEGRARLLAQAKPLLSALRAEGLSLQMMREVADLSGVGLLELQNYMAGPAGGPSNRPQGRSGSGSTTPSPAPAFVRRRDAPRQQAVRAGMPSLERRLRLLLVCHPQLRERLEPNLPDPLMLPELVRPWVAALANVNPDAPLASVLESLRAAGLAGMPDVERDLASDWGGVPGLSLDEAINEFDGALIQLERRAFDVAARQAASDLQESGVTDEARRRQLLELLATQRRS